MTESLGKPDLGQALASLQKDREALPWDRRRLVVKALAEAISSIKPTDEVLTLVHLLAEDPKWEVRQDVAELLLMLPPKDFGKLAPRLAKDSNACVRGSAERALEKRVRAELEERHVRRGMGQVRSQLDAFERVHGAPARKRTERICELYKDTLVGAMMHDWRSILTNLKTNGGLLIKDVEARGDARAKVAAGRLAEGLVLLERTLEDMDDFSTPPELKNRRERVRDVLETALEMARGHLRSGGIEPEAVTVDVAVPETLVFDVTKPLVVMALTNIVKNAFEAFSKPDGGLAKGKIVIEAVQDGAMVAISVRDNGKGFSEAEWAAYQALVPGRVNKSKRRSTGYGLAIARRNIEVHGGKVHIETKEDQGTEVNVTLPITGKARGRA